VIWLGGVARAQVLSAAGDLLVERGFDQLDLTAVAQRARVGKTTIYRRWGSVTRLIGDLLSDMAEQSVPRAAPVHCAGTCARTPSWSCAPWPTRLGRGRVRRAGVGVVFRVDGGCTGRRVGVAPVN